MRPIQLQMSGLQSYRELQTIDFSRLTGAGVFGIFGPTGSGKSSILDAVTLSLYGKVERASGGTQAIMNHAEQTLFVSFTFELGNAGGTQRYRVERQFKRSSELSIQGTISRLLHIRGEETIVLADKAGEVNQQVQSILGLSMQDFTRAVVLPQGKFAEFLTLTGKDRRQMLQRLFHLEQYGDQLSAKVSGRLKETDAAVKQLAAEQQGLGDASEQALAEANARLLEADREAEQSRLHRQRQEALYDERRQVHEWQQEQAGLEREAAQLAGNEAFVREKERLLEQAEQAERLRPFLEQAAVAAKEAQHTEAELLASQSRQASADAVFEQADLANQQSQQRLAEGESPLLLRLDQLQQALVLQQELDKLEAQMRTEEQAHKQAKAEWDNVQAELHKNAETKERALLKQAELKEQLKRLEVSASDRQQLQTAVQEKQAIETLEAQRREYESERLQKSEAVQLTEHRLRELLAAKEASAHGLHELLSGALDLTERSRAVEERLEKLPSLLSAAAEHYRREWMKQQRSALAAQLAEQLTQGEACPVCGSLEHPAPLHQAGDIESGEDASERVYQRLQDLQQQAGQRQFALKQHGQRITGIHKRITELWASLAAGTGAAKSESESEAGHRELRLEAAPALELASGSPPLQADRSAADSAGTYDIMVIDRVWFEIQEAASALEPQLDDLELRCTARQKELQLLEQQLAQAEARHQAAEAQLVEAEGKLAAAAGNVRQQSDSWRSRYPALAWDTAQQQLAELLEKERLADELRGRIEKSIPFLDGLLARMDELQRSVAELDRTALQLHERLQGLAQLAADKSRQLAQRAPGGGVPQQIAEATSALEELRLRAQQARQAHAAALAEQQQAAQRRSAAAEAAAAAARQLAQAERVLDGALAESGFASREAAAGAALAPEVRREWSALAAAHREREQSLRVALAQLAAKLQGRVLSAAEWEATQAALAAAKAAAEAALAAQARAAQGASELAARHARWSELEARRAELAAQVERLGKLQAVLKANAFVEYLAEEQLMQVSRAASERLGQLTRRRYAIEVDSGGGFVIRDDANGGVKRPVSTLSGGETFLTSLALALALSAQIQLKGEYPLEFFFLDEGFGTLDQELLDMVIGALEKLHMDRLAVGVISHVPELRARLPRKLIVHPAEPSGRGSRIEHEEL